MSTDITPYIGIEDSTFGQSVDEIKALLGEPDQISTESYEDGIDDITLSYTGLGIELSFISEDAYKLSLITIYSPKYTIKGEAIIGLSESEMVQKLSAMDFVDFSLEEEFPDYNAKDYTIHSKGISIWTEEGIVNSITLFPEVTDSDEIIWP